MCSNAMGEAAGLGIIWFAFIAWLMWSNKVSKETFLFYAWSLMLGGGSIYFFIKFMSRWL